MGFNTDRFMLIPFLTRFGVNTDRFMLSLRLELKLRL